VTAGFDKVAMMMRPLSSKSVASRDEERIAAALEVETPVHEVNFDEIVIPVNGGARCVQSQNVQASCGKRTVCAAIALIAAGVLMFILLLPRHASSSFNIDEFSERYIPQYSLAAARNNASSPQARALAFINDTAYSYPTYRLQQRYALAVLYYSTTLSDSFTERALGEENECSWFWYPGLDIILKKAGWSKSPDICTNDKRYQILVVGGFPWNGTIPAELEMLRDLQFLHLDGHFVAGSVPPEL
jgi:hypothetical protein